MHRRQQRPPAAPKLRRALRRKGARPPRNRGVQEGYAKEAGVDRAALRGGQAVAWDGEDEAQDAGAGELRGPGHCLRTEREAADGVRRTRAWEAGAGGGDRKSTRLNSSHANISYAVFCLKKKYNMHPQLDISHTLSLRHEGNHKLFF